MRATRLVARDFRNLGWLELDLPAEGAVFLGANGQGKTNVLEALYYPVLLRSVRGARDPELVRHGEAGFFVRVGIASSRHPASVVEAGFGTAGRRKRVAIDGAETDRLTDALGLWLAVAFLPTDVALVSGNAATRRHFLDRTLCLADPGYLRALRRYRAALEQRNAALRQGMAAAAWAFDEVLATSGARLVVGRLDWLRRFEGYWAEACEALGEPMAVTLSLRGNGELADPTAWPALLERQRARDLQARSTGLGPHRDDLDLALAGAPLRVVGSTGQQRTAAVALKLCERETLAQSSGEAPALLLDDVFAELDGDRQRRLARRLELSHQGTGTPPQVFVTAPRTDELPGDLSLPIFQVSAGAVRADVEAAR